MLCRAQVSLLFLSVRQAAQGQESLCIRVGCIGRRAGAGVSAAGERWWSQLDLGQQQQLGRGLYIVGVAQQVQIFRSNPIPQSVRLVSPHVTQWSTRLQGPRCTGATARAATNQAARPLAPRTWPPEEPLCGEVRGAAEGARRGKKAMAEAAAGSTGSTGTRPGGSEPAPPGKRHLSRSAGDAKLPVTGRACGLGSE